MMISSIRGGGGSSVYIVLFAFGIVHGINGWGGIQISFLRSPSLSARALEFCLLASAWQSRVFKSGSSKQTRGLKGPSVSDRFPLSSIPDTSPAHCSILQPPSGPGIVPFTIYHGSSRREDATRGPRTANRKGTNPSGAKTLSRRRVDGRPPKLYRCRLCPALAPPLSL
jgi:hypothetical protein